MKWIAPLAAIVCLSATATASDTGVDITDVVVGSGDAIGTDVADVKVHYTGTLADGTVFDSSRTRGMPFQYRANAGRVIAGWESGVRGMKVGGVRKLVIPPHLGYGDRDMGAIPPGSTLTFEIELLSVSALRMPPSKPPTVSAEKWIETGSGLRYADLGVCTGDTPPPGSVVSAEYTGWLASGQMFDSSYNRADPLSFPLGAGRVIKGWDEGVASMSKGCERLFEIPANLAYGDRGAGGLIPPGATLTFQIKLVDYKP